MLPEYSSLMQETSREVDPLIEQALADIPLPLTELPRLRLGKPRLRDLAIRLGYELTGGKNWREILPVCAAYELENSSSYAINWVLDEKGVPRDRKEQNDLIISGFVLRERADSILRKAGLDSLVASINTIQYEGYLGQHNDQRILIIENLDEYPTPESFLQDYEQRCVRLSGVFYGYCLLSGSIVAGTAQNTLYDIGRTFGSGLQAANDLGDFALPNESTRTLEKQTNDQFSDLQQGKLTLPIYFLLTTNPEDACNIRSKVGKNLTEED